jgi:glycerol-3-phosphate dehydrogenase subunit B
MARADVGVVGAGLAGLATAVALAERGARVHVLARGHAASHWAAGGMDLGVVAGADTAAQAIARLAARPGHPYGVLGHVVPEALVWIRGVLARDGVELFGEIGDPIRAVPTAIGSTRWCGVLPAGMAAARVPWREDERLVVCGPAGFRDFWPEAIAASLRRPASWRGQPGPARVDGISVELPALAGRHNLSGLDLARAFDDATWRDAALDAMARALEHAGHAGGPGRVALPAVLGLHDHAAVMAAARRRLPLTPFEVPLVPPSVPGLRLYQALRAALMRAGGRIQVGEAVHGVIGADGRVTRLIAPAAAREFVLSVGAVVLATGGIAGGGILATPEGTLIETVLGLPVVAPPSDQWLLADTFDPRGHPLEAAGVRTDRELRPVGLEGHSEPLAGNVRVVGSLLAGQRYLREGCGDGVAIASAFVAARALAGSSAETRQAVAAAPATPASLSAAR